MWFLVCLLLLNDSSLRNILSKALSICLQVRFLGMLIRRLLASSADCFAASVSPTSITFVATTGPENRYSSIVSVSLALLRHQLANALCRLIPIFYPPVPDFRAGPV